MATRGLGSGVGQCRDSTSTACLSVEGAQASHTGQETGILRTESHTSGSGAAPGQ